MSTPAAGARPAEPTPAPLTASGSAELPDAYADDSEFAIMARTMVLAMQEDRLNEAEALYAKLCVMDPRAEQVLIFPVLFAIQRGQAMEALQQINQLPAGRCPELRVLCLHVIGDPIWHAEATALLESPDPAIRQAMQELLSQSAPA